MSENLDELRTTELAGRLRLLGLRKDIEPGLMHAAADRLDRLDVLLLKAGQVEREIRKALGYAGPDWMDDASPEEIARRFDALPKAEVVTAPPATWSGICVECACSPGQYYFVNSDRWICARCRTEQDTLATAAVFAMRGER